LAAVTWRLRNRIAIGAALVAAPIMYAPNGATLIELAKRSWGIVVEVVKKPAEQIGFAVLPRRWVVERTFSWLMRFRRLVRDYERPP
jgi:transposase